MFIPYAYTVYTQRHLALLFIEKQNIHLYECVQSKQQSCFKTFENVKANVVSSFNQVLYFFKKQILMF